MQARVKTATHEEGDMWREERKMYFLFFLYFSFVLQAEISTLAQPSARKMKD